MSLYSKAMDFIASEILLKFPEKRTIWTDVLPYHGECNKYSAPSNHTVIGTQRLGGGVCVCVCVKAAADVSFLCCGAGEEKERERESDV